MKKTIIWASLIMFWAVAFTACGGGAGTTAETTDSLAATGEQATEQPKKKAPKNLRNEADSFAYAQGLHYGAYIKGLDTVQLKKINTSVNLKNVIAAINDAMSGKAKMTEEDAFNFLNEYFMVRIPERMKKIGDDYLANLEKENRNIQKTESGLMYEIIEAGDQEMKPTKNEDKVKVIYEGRLMDGKVFDSSIERGDTTEFALNRVIRGWGEGMKLIGKGGKIKLYIPSDLGYGQRGMPPAIQGNEPLIFDVTLVDVIPAPEEEEAK